MAEIFHLFNIKTGSPENVFWALAEIEGLAGWWTTSTEGSPELGGTIIFRFPGGHRMDMRVTGLEPGEKVEWECTQGDEQWLGTKIRFELYPKDGSVDVKFYHSNWSGQTDLFGICNYHWGWSRIFSVPYTWIRSLT